MLLTCTLVETLCFTRSSRCTILLLPRLFGILEIFVFAGHPSVTMAPSVHQRLECPSRLSLMNQQVCTCLKIFIHVLHFDLLKWKIIFSQALNEVDDWEEEECSDEDSYSPACSDHHVIQRYWCLHSKHYEWNCTFELKCWLITANLSLIANGMALWCFCRASQQKMTECSKRKLIQQEKNKPKAEQIDREDIAATPSTEGRAPNHTGRRGKMCFLKKEVKLQQ